MKKLVYVLSLPLVVVIGLVWANRATKPETEKKPTPKPLSEAEQKMVRKNWEASPDGTRFKEWEASEAGQRVYASEARIQTAIRNYSDMEGIITATSLPAGSRLGFGVMVKIKGEDYILAFGVENKDLNEVNFTDEFKELRTLKVNDKIVIRSRSVTHAPKYADPIVRGDFIKREGKTLYQRSFPKDGC